MGLFNRVHAAKEQRDKIIAYKNTFKSNEKLVLLDLMNKFWVLNPIPNDENKERREGERQVVLYILGQCHINLEEFDKMLGGE